MLQTERSGQLSGTCRFGDLGTYGIFHVLTECAKCEGAFLACAQRPPATIGNPARPLFTVTWGEVERTPNRGISILFLLVGCAGEECYFRGRRRQILAVVEPPAAAADQLSDAAVASLQSRSWPSMPCPGSPCCDKSCKKLRTGNPAPLSIRFWTTSACKRNNDPCVQKGLHAVKQASSGQSGIQGTSS